MALCSLSTGTSETACRCAAAITTSPAATSTSLFARAICLPHSIALYVAGRPTTPTAADTTISASGRVATPSIPSGPNNISGAGWRDPLSMSQSFRAPASVATDTILGRCRTTCSAARAMFDPAARATISNRPGNESGTLKHALPIEPVDPRIEMRFMCQQFYRGLRDFANGEGDWRRSLVTGRCRTMLTIGTPVLDIPGGRYERAV